MKKEENILGYEKIGKLIRKFSIPCIISLLVNSLYNIVDQIFIGWGVGYLGNGATNVVFPFTMIALAFALMFGVVYAILDEFHQSFISGRSAQIRDVCIDTCGVITGEIISCFVKKHKKLLKKEIKN